MAASAWEEETVATDQVFHAQKLAAVFVQTGWSAPVTGSLGPRIVNGMAL